MMENKPSRKGNTLAKIFVITGAAVFMGGAAMYGAMGRDYSGRVINVNEEFSADDIKSISVHNGPSELTITKSSDNKAHITGTDVPEGSTVILTGGKLQIRSGKKRYFFHVDFSDLTKHSEWVVELPEKEYDSINLDTGSGASQISDITIKGDLIAATGSGGVQLADVSCGSAALDTGSGAVVIGDLKTEGKLQIESGSGSIHVDDTECGKLTLDSGSGSTHFNNVTSTGLNAQTGSGSMEYSGAINGDISIDSGSGSCTLDLTNPQSDFDSKYSVRTDEGTGKITINYGK